MKSPVFEADTTNAYPEGPPRQVPGYDSLHRMVSLLLSERTPANGRVLVLGAGGGQELKALAQAHSSWSFDGVDPSIDMLQLAEQVVEQYAERIQFHHGYIDIAPDIPFDAATSILTFHFIAYDQRLETLKQIRRRLNTGAPFILLHLSFPQNEPERSIWIARHVAFGLANGTDPTHAENARQAISNKLTILSPEEEVSMLHQSGFTNTSLFYAGLSIKGWVTYAN